MSIAPVPVIVNAPVAVSYVQLRFSPHLPLVSPVDAEDSRPLMIKIQLTVRSDSTVRIAKNFLEKRDGHL